MNRTASPNHQWVWTEYTESIGIYPDERKAGQPVHEWYRNSCPKSWVDKGYVKEAPIEGQLTLF